jgi:metallo-beta-lactamase family protein
VTEDGTTRSITFSGDIGNAGRPLLRDPHPPPPSDFVVMESTYGDRLHREMEPSVEELLSAIEDTFQRGGNVVIPTFALERAQELLFHLREGVEEGRLPRSTKVFLDSPMAISATEIYRNHPECYDQEASAMLASGVDPFAVPGLRFTRKSSDSRAINDIQQGAVILAGSGMATGGRVRHHLRHNLRRPESSVVFVSFASKGTPARQVIDGARTLRLFGNDIPVRSKVHTINGFSAHGDRDELVAWHRAVAAPVTLVVHGEEEVMRSLAEALPPGRVEIPARGDAFEL